MSRQRPFDGPDLFFAGGEALTRHGTEVRRTDQVEDEAAEVFTRNSTAKAIGRDGIIRAWEIDAGGRIEWLNEIDLDPTRNLNANSTRLDLWTPTNGATLENLGGGSWRVTDADPNGSQITAPNTAAQGGATYTVSVKVKKQSELTATSTVSLRLSFTGGGTLFDIVVDPVTGEAFNPNGANAFGVEDLGSHWRIFCTDDNDGANIELRLFPAFGLRNTGGAFNGAAEGSAVFSEPQYDKAATFTPYQATPRDTDRKFPSLLLEAAATNLRLQSENIGALWTFAGASNVLNNFVAPDGVTSADQIVESALLEEHICFIDQAKAASAITYTVSVYVHEAGKQGIQIRVANDAATDRAIAKWDDFTQDVDAVLSDLGAYTALGFTREALPDGWYRLSLSFVSDATAKVRMTLFVVSGGTTFYTGNGVHGLRIWGSQMETGAAPSSYIPTGGVSDSRAIEEFDGAFPHPPQEMTAYVRFQDFGTLDVAGRVFLVSGAASAEPWFQIRAMSGWYIAQHNNGALTITSNIGLVDISNAGDLIELRAVLFADGSVQIAESINGAAELLAARSAANPMAAAWGGDRATINSLRDLGGAGYGRYLAVKVERGVRTREYMRAL